MEEQPKEGEAGVAEHWFSKWERQCLAEAEQEEQLPPELQDEATAEAAGLKREQQRLWHLFQISATAVAQLYKDSVCPQPELSMWDPFQSAAMAVTSLYKESGDAHQRSFDLGVQVGHQRRMKDVLEWVKKGRSTILREDLISFLCGKVPRTIIIIAVVLVTTLPSSLTCLRHSWNFKVLRHRQVKCPSFSREEAEVRREKGAC